MLTIIERSKSNNHLFATMLSPEQLAQLDAQEGSSAGVVLGATCFDTMIGVFVALPKSHDSQTYLICTLWSLKKYAEFDVVPSLLEAGEEKIRALNAREIEMRAGFSEWSSQTQSFLTILRERGWQETRLLETNFFLHDPAIMSAPWFRRDLPAGYDLCFWRDVPEQAAQELRAKEETVRRRVGYYLSPFEVNPFDPHTSVAVCKQSSGEIVGWMINDVQQTGCVCFRRLFVLPDERMRGLFYPLVANSVFYAFQHHQRATFNVAAKNPKMKTSVLRMMKPFCDRVINDYYCKKTL